MEKADSLVSPNDISGTAQPQQPPNGLVRTCRLQPSAIVTDENCAACDFNRPGKTCLRKMDWVWRGEHFASNVAEYNSIKNQLASEVVAPAAPDQPARWGAVLPTTLHRQAPAVQ